MFENIQAVIFDLDGTLIDSMWLWKAIDIDYLSGHGIEFPLDLQREIEGKSFTETAIYFKERFNIKDDLEAIKCHWNEMARDYYTKRVTLKEGAIEFIQHLKANNIKTGIGTSNSKELLQVILERFELKDYFESVRTSCEVDKGKPHPDIFLKVANDFQVKPENCLVFEDVPMGIMAAKSAGMKVCAIYDQTSEQYTPEIKELSDYYIDSFLDIMRKVEEKQNAFIFTPQ